MNFLKVVCKIGFVKRLISKQFNAVLSKQIFGLTFKNPVGLGAGFDKNAKYLFELEVLGFGFVEIGTVTPLPQNGNDKPRLFRLAKDEALINRMGFNNDGVKVVVKRLKEWKEKKSQWSMINSTSNHELQTTNYKLIIGGNIGKNKITSNEDAWKDYEICFRELFDHIDYFVVNVSSPNTPGLRELQQKDSLQKIFIPLININQQKPQPKPLLLKISPDLNKQDLDDIINLALEIKLDGLVVANTTITRGKLQTTNYKLQTNGAGGLSGKPLQKKSTELIEYICSQTNYTLPVIASGGIFNGEDAKEKIEAGAGLVQVWTGFIYTGPSIIKKICNSFAGYKNNI